MSGDEGRIARNLIDSAKRLLARDAKAELSPEIEREFGRAAEAIEAMRRVEVPPTAENFAIWRAHVAEERPELSKVIFEVEKKGGFGPKMNAAIYEQFFGAEHEAAAVYESSRKTERLLVALDEEMNKVGVDSRSSGERLADLGEALGNQELTKTAKSLIASVIHETSEMRMVANRLERRLLQSASEIAELRANLEAAQREANTDPLTGLANRKLFDFTLKRRVRDFEGGDGPLSLALIDVDHFKKFNDTWGHPIGDVVLRSVARALRENTKQRDLVARFGGEEFAVVMPETDLDAAAAFAEKLRAVVASLCIEAEGGKLKPDPVTISLGVAQCKRDEPPERLVKRADRALYLAKDEGRNRVATERELRVVGRPKG